MKYSELNVRELKICMAKRGMNQKTLAKVAGVVPTTLNRIMKGDNSPTLRTVISIAEALEMTPEQFTEVFYNKKGEGA